jgi:hypothetical protein
MRIKHAHNLHFKSATCFFAVLHNEMKPKRSYLGTFLNFGGSFVFIDSLSSVTALKITNTRLSVRVIIYFTVCNFWTFVPMFKDTGVHEFMLSCVLQMTHLVSSKLAPSSSYVSFATKYYQTATKGLWIKRASPPPPHTHTKVSLLFFNASLPLILICC